MSGVNVGRTGASPYAAPADEIESAAQGAAAGAGAPGAPEAGAPACRLSVAYQAGLPLAELERLPAHELAELAHERPEIVARLSLTKLTEIGNACPSALDVIFHSDAARTPAAVPAGYATGTHVYVPGSGVDLPFLVQQGVNRWRGKEFKPGTGEMVDDVSLLPDSKALAYVGDINAAIKGAAGGQVTAPVNADGRASLITDYTAHGQAFGVKLRWIDEFRELPGGTLLGVSYWMDGADPKKWSYVLLDMKK